MVKMVDISEKEPVLRIARARGRIKLRESTIKRIVEGRVEKGDVITVAKLAAIQAVKKTPEIIQLCHPIPIENVGVEVRIEKDYVEVEVEVKAIAKTGVEMEALSGVSVALLNIWDMVKKYEKDEMGQYPSTAISDISVLEKRKDVQTFSK
ncbi:MAG: cyclic pyranopterin monophosphate synthase MoaC [Candidatus Methanodesulfokora sp.]|jgi:cyclic pyranopterin phosphate synthase